MKSDEDELTEDELEQSADWDSRNFGDEEFLPNGGRYQVNHNYYMTFISSVCNLKLRLFCRVDWIYSSSLSSNSR